MQNTAKIAKAAHIANEKNAGKSIKHHDHHDQSTIGAALGWNARIAIIATERTIPGHDKHPTLNVVFLIEESFSIIYKLHS